MTKPIAKPILEGPTANLSSFGTVANRLWLFGPKAQGNRLYRRPTEGEQGYRFTSKEVKEYVLPPEKEASEFVVNHRKPTFRKVDPFRGTVIGKTIAAKQQK